MSASTNQLSPRTDNHQAFSLVELSIVLVILGLLIGGVLTGKSLIRAAELRSVSKDFSLYKASLHTFREKYFYWPGDMPNAVQFWGAQIGATTDGVDATCAGLTTASTTALTCNGDGSGFIADCDIACTRQQWYESTRAWQHLANAGLISGSYSGVSGSGRTVVNSLPGTNAPANSAGKNAGWNLRSFGMTYSATAEYFPLPAGNFMTLGNRTTHTSGVGPILLPEEAWNVDIKLDDGKPGTGFITSYKGTGALNPNCTVDATATTDYKITFSDAACSLNFQLK